VTTATETVWISIARAARILEKSQRQIRNYVEDGKLRAQRVGGRGWMKVSFDDVCRLREESLQ